MKIHFTKKLPVSLLGGVFLFAAAGIFCASDFTRAVANEKITIDIDTLSYNENILPQGVEGKSYPVFACEAVDGEGNDVKDIDVVVYNPQKEMVPIKDNRFSTDLVGKYSIVYKASKGLTEETTSLTVTVVSESQYNAPYYTFDENIVSACATGEQVALYGGMYGGGNGELLVSAELAYEGSYAEQVPEIENYGLYDYFVPTVEGTYTVKYSVTDIVGEKVTEEKEIVVSDSLAPIMRQPSIATSGLVGEKISFAYTDAIVYVDGKQIYVPVKVYVDDTDVTAAMAYTPESKGVYTVKYEAVNVLDGAQTVANYQQQVKVFDATENYQNKTPYIENYFNFNGLEGEWIASPDSDADKVEGIEYDVYLLKASGSATNVSASFKTPIPAQYANMKIALDDITAAFSNLYITYTDSIDGEKQITICLRKNTENSEAIDVYVSGVYKTTLDTDIFCFAIDCETGILTNSINENTVSEICEIACYDNGKRFDGFENGNVYMSISAEEVNDSFVLKLYAICTQNISGVTSDNGKPFFIVPDNFSKVVNAEYGREYKLQQLSAFDLYSTKVDVKAIIVAPDNTKVFDGIIDEDSTIMLSQYGKYTITYRAIDSSDNFREMKCAIIITDREAPTISKVSLPSTVKVGATLTLPTATVSDNATENVVNWVYIICPDYQKVRNDTTEYTFTEAGTYFIKYGAEDDAGNITVITYTVVCE